MKWIRKDYKGNPQVWYSEDEYNKNKELLLTCLRFINHLRENNVLDEIEIGNTSCKNCLNKIQLFFVLFKNYFGDVNFNVYKEIERIKESEE